MMRLAVIALFSGLVSTAALAEQDANQILEVPMIVPCDTKERMTSVIKKYGEEPFVEAKGVVTVITNSEQTITGRVTIWVNPQTWTYSITLEDQNGSSKLMCMLTSGSKFSPAGNPI